MSIIAAALNPRPRAGSWPDWPASDDRWYYADLASAISAAGGALAIDADTMLRCGTVLAAVRFLADSWAMCPPSTYERVGRNMVERPDHYSQRVLRHPNAWQTGYTWRHLMATHRATWGNAYSRIMNKPRFASELWPINPSKVRLLRQRADGSLLYEIKEPHLPAEMVGGEEILHFRDLSVDGFRGVPMYQLIRNVVSIALLAEQHEGTFLKKGARISGLLTTTSPLTQEQRKLLKDSVNDDMGPSGVTGGLGILPLGVDIKPLTLGSRSEQRAELSDQNVAAILRFLGVPGVVVGFADKTATYASAKEFFESGGIKHCVLPKLTSAEAEEEHSLLPKDSGLSIKHNLDVLLRANLKDRYDALSKALGGAPWLTRNEVRLTDDWAALEEPGMDEVQAPVNMGTGVEPVPEGTPARPAAPPPPPADDGGQGDEATRAAIAAPLAVVGVVQSEATMRDGLARLYAHDNAGRVLRREQSKIAERGRALARDPRAWRAWVLDYYDKHAAHVTEVMHVTPEQARAYCDAQAAALIAGGAGVAEGWESEVPEKLVALALGEAA